MKMTAQEIADDISQTLDCCTKEYRDLIERRIDELTRSFWERACIAQKKECVKTADRSFDVMKVRNTPIARFTY